MGTQIFSKLRFAGQAQLGPQTRSQAQLGNEVKIISHVQGWAPPTSKNSYSLWRAVPALHLLQMEEYILISESHFWDKARTKIGDEQKPGVYKLRCLKEDSQGFIPICRLLGKDDEGILYIGAGKLLLARVTELMMALRSVMKIDYNNHSKHTCSFKYENINIQQKYPYTKLCVTLYPIDNGNDPYIFERELLENYEKTYGEAPPFNEARSRAKRISDR